MPVLTKLVAVYLFLLALVVGGNYIAYPLYERGAEPDLQVWLIIDWFMAAGLILMLLATFAQKRLLGEDSGWRGYLEANAVFYLTLAVAISFFPNWFVAEWADRPANANVWAFIDALLPILAVVIGLRLWRKADATVSR